MNTVDRHSVAYAVSTEGKSKADTTEELAPTLTVTRKSKCTAVCYGISRSALCGGTNAGGMPIESDLMPSMTANGVGGVCVVTDYKSPSDGTEDVLAFKERAGKHGGGKGILIGYNRTFTLSTEQQDSICYAVENHPQDSRVDVKEDVCQTLNAKMGTGGG